MCVIVSIQGPGTFDTLKYDPTSNEWRIQGSMESINNYNKAPDTLYTQSQGTWALNSSNALFFYSNLPIKHTQVLSTHHG